MPHVLESGRLELSLGEAAGYHAAAERLHKTCETALDLAQPITAEEWIFLELAQAALEGNLELLERVITKVEAEIHSREQSC